MFSVEAIVSRELGKLMDVADDQLYLALRNIGPFSLAHGYDS